MKSPWQGNPGKGFFNNLLRPSERTYMAESNYFGERLKDEIKSSIYFSLFSIILMESSY